ncbi:MAG: glycosyltransferase [Psychroflexus halocasei]
MSYTQDIVVLIPHYNNPNGLLRSVESVDDFENKVLILIVDDGSSKNQIDESQILACTSAKVNFLYLKANSGIENALNYGLNYIQNNLAHIKYISRLDCDDICVNNRFEKQYQYLESHQEIDFIGSYVKFVNLNRQLIFNLKLPITNAKIKKKMYFNAMFIHPAIFFRKEVLDQSGLYPVNRKAAEDYAFFFNVIKNNRVANIPEYLVECVVDPDGISGKQRKKQVLSRIQVILDNFYFGYYPIMGLMRSFILLIIPRKTLNVLKSKLK